jgi:archaeal flagellar protein FlaJ
LLKYIHNAGYKTISQYLLLIVIPSIVVSFILFFITFFLFDTLIYIPFIFPFIAIIFIILFPIMKYEQKKINIHEKIHLFITYAGTLSTLKINRTMLFKKISEEKEYGELRRITKRIIYLAKEWNLGYAKTCRKIAYFSPSDIFRDFLDRLAAVLDFGEDLEIFLVEEQDAVMDDYANEYKQSIQNIRLLEDVFISLTISIAFAMSAALLLPLLMGVSIMQVVQYSLLGLIFMDIMLVILIKGFIPSDKICHNLHILDYGTKKILKYFFIITPISFFLIGTLLYLDFLPFLFNIAIGFTPLFIVGMIASKEENEVFKRDKAFPAFIRAIGGTAATKGGSITTSLGALRVHDFGVLNSMLINVYRRLKIGSDRFKSWFYFAGETGSNLINYFIHIFVKSIYLGGDGIKISEIISKNFSRLLSLRKLRLQLASGLRGALYGALLGFITTVYMSTSITQMLSGMFTSALMDAQGQDEMAGLISSIIPEIPPIDMVQVNLYIGIIVVFHSLISALIIKFVDGGNKYAALFDFVIMIWIGTALSYGIPLISKWTFGNLHIVGA